MEITLKPIGKVVNAVEKSSEKVDWSQVVSILEVNPELEEGLEGIEEFNRIMVIFWFHLAEETCLKVHPRGDKSKPLRGVFSTRAPVRPNHIGVTVVELLRREGNRLVVKGLDAYNGTPILDIKPYFPEGEGDERPPWVKGG
jgi:tRNA-Thr(GGU) m(6)t(6)A37 methyltransferase TsaA